MFVLVPFQQTFPSGIEILISVLSYLILSYLIHTSVFDVDTVSESSLLNNVSVIEHFRQIIASLQISPRPAALC